MKTHLLFVSAIFIFSHSFAQNLTGKILFSHFNKATQTDTIYAMDNNGHNISFVTVGYRPRLSHNGNYLAFSNGPNPNASYNASLWIRDLAIGHDTLIVNNVSDYLDYYDFYPDDLKMVYSQGCNIYTTNTDGTNSYTNIGCVPCDCYSDDPTVRLSDSMIVYHNVHFGIYTAGFDGSNPSQVPHTTSGDLYPLWSPDGQWIVFQKSLPGLGYVTNDLYKIKADGTDSTRLTFFASTDTMTSDPVWASDMQSVYFIGRVAGTLGFYRVNTDGSGTHALMKEWTAGGSVWDFWLGLADSISSNPVGITEPASVVPEFSISPNPATTNFMMSFSIYKSMPVTIDLYDLTGRKQRAINNSNLSPGEYHFEVSTANLSAGNYIMKIFAGDNLSCQRIVIAK